MVVSGPRLSRRTLFALAAAGSLAACSSSGKNEGADVGAGGGGTVVVDSWGGDFQKAQSELIFTPFQTTAGTKVSQLSDGENIYAKVKAQAGRKEGEIDLVHGDASWLMRGRAENLWAKVDPSVFSGAKIYDDARDEYGLGILYWSFNIVHNPAKFPTPPKTWAEVWAHAKANPKRVAMFSPRPNYVIEAALMASGLAPDQVYPLTPEKFDRAYAKLDEIKDRVVWYEGGGQGGRLFEEGQVDIGMFYGGDAFALKIDGKPAGVTWEQGLYTRDYWMVPANAPHKAAAFELMKYALQAPLQAKFAERTGYGPVATEAGPLISAETKAKLTSIEPQKSQQLSYDYTWWGANDDEQLDRWTKWLRS